MTNYVENEGAKIAYTQMGSGPLVVLIPGANGESVRYTPLMMALKDDFTVVRLDRRAAGESTGDAGAALDLKQATRDVKAVIEAMDMGPAIVFGSSAGAVIALNVGEQHPEIVKQLLVHEPPVTEILPEPQATEWRELFIKVKYTFDTDGALPAMKLFMSETVGLGVAAQPGDQSESTHDRFLRHEFRVINSFKPDLGLLKSNAIPVVMQAGDLSGDACYAETARYIAKSMPCELAVVPGHHIGYVSQPAEFADAFRKITADVL
ncbi:alpha/beta fold hydrolase [Marivivens donghaensis]|nr:alpha/beta hydrolase [Marivivens donghaensis]